MNEFLLGEKGGEVDRMSPADKVMKWVEDQELPPDRRKAPLRTVVGEHQNTAGSWVEELECGHEQHKRTDHIGPTNAYRRRCLKCLEGRS